MGKWKDELTWLSFFAVTLTYTFCCLHPWFYGETGFSPQNNQRYCTSNATCKGNDLAGVYALFEWTFYPEERDLLALPACFGDLSLTNPTTLTNVYKKNQKWNEAAKDIKYHLPDHLYRTCGRTC